MEEKGRGEEVEELLKSRERCIPHESIGHRYEMSGDSE
jgi:hypothetical protein